MITLLALLLLVQITQQATYGSAIIEGRVLKADSTDPIAVASITLEIDNGQSQLAPNAVPDNFEEMRALLARSPGPRAGRVQNSAIITDERGYFRINDVKAGRYRLSAGRTGYLRGEYGQTNPYGFGRVIDVTAGKTIKDVIVTLLPTSVVSGKIRDGFGNPAVNVTVRALQNSYESGQRVLRVAKTTATNDLGEYRLADLEPGKYIVGIVPNRNVSSPAQPLTPRQVSGSVATGQLVNLTTYYPGSADPATATVINLLPGEEQRNADATILRKSSVHVKGTVRDASGKGRGTNLALVPLSRIPGEPSIALETTSDSQGNFDIAGVIPGLYQLAASVGGVRSASSNPSIPTRTGDQRLAAVTTVNVGSRDEDSVRLVLDTGFAISGRVTLEGGPSQSDTASLQNLRIQLQGQVPDISPIVSLNEADGRFRATGILPGQYRISVAGLPKNSYVQSIRLAGVDALTQPMTLLSDPANELAVVVSYETGNFEATVEGPAGKTAIGVFVILVPDSTRRGRFDLYRFGVTNDRGEATIEGVAPGEYKVFAAEAVQRDGWQDAEFIARYESQAQSVRIQRGAKTVLQLRQVPTK